jgi:hypothetical protein
MSRQRPVRAGYLSDALPPPGASAEKLKQQQNPIKISSEKTRENPAPTLQEYVEVKPQVPQPMKDEVRAAGPETRFEVKQFAADEILALPFAEQKKFLTRNQLHDPQNFERFRPLSQLTVIEEYLKGDYHGTLEAEAGQNWLLHMNIDGLIEENHFQGELAVELMDQNHSSISRSHLRGPLDDHIRVVDEGERSSLLIQAAHPEVVRMYQVFIGSRDRKQLAGNYYERNGEGKLQFLGSFVVKKGEL